MNDLVKVSGMVLSASPVGDYDKRLVIETCELGKITAFGRGARRQGSPLLAAANPFVTGEFFVYPGRDSYRLVNAEIREYFRELTAAQPEVYIGFYFLDLIDYYGHESIDGRDMINLTYLALKALLNPEIDNRVVRAAFELRLIAMNGDYYPDSDRMDEKLFRICAYITGAPLIKLFSFNLSPDMIKEVAAVSGKVCKNVIDRPLKSKSIMESMITE